MSYLDIIVKIILPILGFAFTVIIGIATYFIKDLLSGIKELRTQINELNTNIKIILFRNDNCDQKIEKINLQLDTHSKQLEVTRMRLHEIGNIINGLQLKDHLPWPKHKGDV